MNPLFSFFNRLFPKTNTQAPSLPHETKNPKPSFPNIIAAKVLDISKHPNADRLRLIKLDIGGIIVEPVVCGATNFNTGDIVALALPGAKIAQNIHSDTHEPFTLEKAKIRGVESQGMICAAFELGLSTAPGSGVMVLNPLTKPGSQFSPEMLQ
jgi:phenylalanyl-tRNA synthetase beta chain